jgi:hypothetical protein
VNPFAQIEYRIVKFSGDNGRGLAILEFVVLQHLQSFRLVKALDWTDQKILALREFLFTPGPACSGACQRSAAGKDHSDGRKAFVQVFQNAKCLYNCSRELPVESKSGEFLAGVQNQDGAATFALNRLQSFNENRLAELKARSIKAQGGIAAGAPEGFQVPVKLIDFEFEFSEIVDRRLRSFQLQLLSKAQQQESRLAQWVVRAEVVEIDACGSEFEL